MTSLTVGPVWATDGFVPQARPDAAESQPAVRPDPPRAAPVPIPRVSTAGALAPQPPLRPVRRPREVCTPDGAHCIRPGTYVRDVCRVIGDTASEAGLDPHFLTRLVWRESRFDAHALSPAGAMGIAQFIPGTAALRGLDDPFNPAEALRAAAHYLADLVDEFGNFGLAAAAYNGGEARLDRFLNANGSMPLETRAYVAGITGHPIEIWRDAPPDKIDLSLDPETDFQTACVTQASAGRVPAFRPDAPILPWSMIYAAHTSPDMARRRALWQQRRFPELLGGTPVTVESVRLPGRRYRLYAVRIGFVTQAEASRQCNLLRAAGGGCMVLNR